MTETIQAFTLVKKRLIRSGFTEIHILDNAGAVAGDVALFSALTKWIILHYSPRVLRYLYRAYPWFIVESNTEAFLPVLYRVLRTDFQHTPKLTIVQFLKQGHYGQHKVGFLDTLMRLYSEKEQSLLGSEGRLLHKVLRPGRDVLSQPFRRHVDHENLLPPEQEEAALWQKRKTLNGVCVPRARRSFPHGATQVVGLMNSPSQQVTESTK